MVGHDRVLLASRLNLTEAQVYVVNMIRDRLMKTVTGSRLSFCN